MALIEKLNAIGDAIRAKTGGTDKLTLDQMPTEINGITTGGTEVEPIVLTGSQNSGCSSQLAIAYIKYHSDKITTNNIHSASQMFTNCDLEYIPFDINMGGSQYQPMASMFENCSKLKEFPKINNATPQQLNNFCTRCSLLREIPEDFGDTWDFSYIQNNNSYSMASIFMSCISLRRIPNNLLKQLWNKASGYYYKFYQNAFTDCYVLDEVIDIMPDTEDSTPMTSNMFSSTFRNTNRIKRIVWALQEDGSPMVVRWSGQTLDLSYYVGYSPARTLDRFTGYNSGITADKEVLDDATYQALKNDPDWFTMGYEAYSRYNHDSAVETINSLPDTSAYLASSGGTNTIKFKGACGSATDGGAINTLTEEEIAVATAKGWTVSLA